MKQGETPVAFLSLVILSFAESLSGLDNFIYETIITTMVVNSTLLLQEMGFSEYEARVYQSLLAENPLTAYEAARKSGIPSSKIYALLARMEDKGLVQVFNREKTKRYIPLEVEEFIEGQRSRLNRNLDQLEKQLSKEEAEVPLAYVWNIKEEDKFFRKAEEIINRSKVNLLISLWKEELNRLLPVLKEADTRGVQISLVLFGGKDSPVGQVFPHPIEDTLFKEKGGRSFALVSDSRLALMGTMSRKGPIDASWSRSPGFSSLAEDYIRHDIYIMKIVKRFEPDLVERFGKGYPLLRDVFSDKEK